MLILCYGITKSGSTLGFELIKAMLRTAGFEQTRLPDGVVKPGHRVNYVEKLDSDGIARLRDAIGDKTKIAVKVHCNLNRPTYLRLTELQSQGGVQIFASYRDPREMCLSLVDAGARARKNNEGPFSEFVTLDDAIPEVEKQINVFRRWGSIPGVVRLGYDMVAWEPDRAIDVIERTVGITAKREAAKHQAFNRSFTQKNKAVKDRHNELTPEQNQQLLERFASFMDNVVLNDNDAWYAETRKLMLGGPQ